MRKEVKKEMRKKIISNQHTIFIYSFEEMDNLFKSFPEKKEVQKRKHSQQREGEFRKCEACAPGTPRQKRDLGYGLFLQ